MRGNPEKITKGSDHVEQACIVCQQKMSPEDDVVLCPRCRSVHHADCWKNKGGCGKTGCPQIAQAVKGNPPQGDGPPPPVSKKTIIGVALAALAVISVFALWPKPPDPAMGRTKIVFLGEAYYELSEHMNELADNYNSISEETYVDLQLLPSGAMDTKLVVLIAANDAPDVIALGDDRFEYFLEQGALLPLGEDPSGEPIYGIQHPGQLTTLVVWGSTDYPSQAVEVLHYFADRIPAADLDLLKELDKPSIPFGTFGM